MTGINRQQATTFEPMEMESLQPPSAVMGSSSPKNGKNSYRSVPLPGHAQHSVGQICLLIKLYVEYYPIVTSIILFTGMGFLLYWLAEMLRSPISRNTAHHDYSIIEMNYNFKAAEIDHWCLWGGDDKCSCDDFTDPYGRLESAAWMNAHTMNMKRINAAPGSNWDVVFIGDEMVEAMNGLVYGLPSPKTAAIGKYWNKTFNTDNGGDFDGVALGVFGDSTANAIWRLQHGESPDNIATKVWWLWIGTNDLGRQGCSEEAVILGILRTAEELAYRDPYAVVVIQGILPRARPGGDGRLEPDRTIHTGLFHHAIHSVNEARERNSLWPSIQQINAELRDFCSKNDHMVYFDAAELFLGSISNAHFRQSSSQIITELMPDNIHPSLEGYQVLGQAIVQELKRIIYDDNEQNDIEEKNAT